jgi:hypothetical protein
MDYIYNGVKRDAVIVTGAAGRWLPPGLVAARRGACAGCPWLAGLTGGRCDYPERPCASLRPWLAAETCPTGQWPQHATEAQRLA